MAHVYSLEGQPVKEVELPEVFKEEIRPDVIKRAVIAAQTHRIQPKATDVMGGKRTSAYSRGPGYGMARIPRIRTGGRAAFAPMAVGGREAHPPRVERKIREKINKKERRLAIRSAIAATALKELVQKRGHKIEKISELPLIVEDAFQTLKKANEVKKVFQKLGVIEDVERAKAKKTIRAGKGKMRGRKYRKAKGPLVVIEKDEGVLRAARNLPGVDVCLVNNLNAELLAPGTHLGRLAIWTESAIEGLRKGLFT
ncbi:MAG: 50S ribosomal protein L4 [Euryarchaeota archaeon]|nr:50S ribosomal protein L4 [Euryarchaeota archaeon]